MSAFCTSLFAVPVSHLFLETNNFIFLGVRPKLGHPSMMEESVRTSGPSKTARFDDFLIVEKSVAKSRLFHLFGIESPGLTSSLSIAEYIRRMLLNQ